MCAPHSFTQSPSFWLCLMLSSAATATSTCHHASRIIITHHHHASHIITTTNTTATNRCIPDHKGFSVNGIALSVTGKILFSVSEDCR